MKQRHTKSPNNEGVSAKWSSTVAKDVCVPPVHVQDNILYRENTHSDMLYENAYGVQLVVLMVQLPRPGSDPTHSHLLVLNVLIHVPYVIFNIDAVGYVQQKSTHSKRTSKFSSNIKTKFCKAKDEDIL
jgi:hypothetical protein